MFANKGQRPNDCVLKSRNTQDCTLKIMFQYSTMMVLLNEMSLSQSDSLRLWLYHVFYFFPCLPDSPILLGTINKSQLREHLHQHRNEVIEVIMCWVITRIVPSYWKNNKNNERIIKSFQLRGWILSLGLFFFIFKVANRKKYFKFTQTVFALYCGAF